MSNSEQLATSIDEAIYRIQKESLCDEEELSLLRAEYEAFKLQQKEIVGWLKGHIPFTETRRQKKRHTGTVSHREAEMLADNLIIARAQMIEVRLFPPDSRRREHCPAAWQNSSI